MLEFPKNATEHYLSVIQENYSTKYILTLQHKDILVKKLKTDWQKKLTYTDWKDDEKK